MPTRSFRDEIAFSHTISSEKYSFSFTVQWVRVDMKVCFKTGWKLSSFLALEEAYRQPCLSLLLHRTTPQFIIFIWHTNRFRRPSEIEISRQALTSSTACIKRRLNFIRHLVFVCHKKCFTILISMVDYFFAPSLTCFEGKIMVLKVNIK